MSHPTGNNNEKYVIVLPESAVSPGFEDNTPTGEMIYLNAEIDKDRLGRLRYTRVTILSDRDESKG